MDNQTEWERYLPLVEFSYNNSYHSSIGMPPYQALYGRPCRTPLSWEKLEDRVIVGQELVQEMEEQPNKSTIQFGKGTKLSPRFVGPFRIKEKIGPVAYRLVLLPHLHKTHDVFHVSVLRQYVSDESHKLDWQDLHVSDMGTVMVEPLRILDRRVRQLRHRTVDQVKVQWDKYSLGSATWEDAETMRRGYPSLFEHL
eukprot:PITA_35559